MLRLTLFAVVLYTTSAICPNGFELVRNGQCYRQIIDAMNVYSPNGPKTAREQCDSFDAVPVMIKNQDDEDYWMSVAKADRKKGGNYGNILLGLECTEDEHWKWTDGSNVNFRPENYDPDLIERCDQNRCMWTMNPNTNSWMQWCNLYEMIDLYCIISPSINPIEADPDCGSFSDDDNDDICYQVGAKATNWTEANAVCNSFGANVASIHSDQENNYVRRLAVSRGLVNGIMLGATIDSKKNSFKWSDGSKWDYDYFAKGFPIDGLGDCLALQTNNAAGQWMNVDCSIDLPFACVRQTDTKVPACDGGLHEEREILYSPGFPATSSEPCDFLLEVEAGMLVEVEILFLEANECCDHLVLFEGTLGGNEIANLSGEKQNGRKFSTKSQNVMRASWQPNGGVNVKGMMITFRGVHKK